MSKKYISPGVLVSTTLVGNQIQAVVINYHPKMPYQKAWVTLRAAPRPEWFPYDGTDLFAADVDEISVVPISA